MLLNGATNYAGMNPNESSRLIAAKTILRVLGNNKEIQKDTFWKYSDAVKEYCGLKSLEYNETSKKVTGKMDEKNHCPILNTSRIMYLRKEEILAIAPKLSLDYKEAAKPAAVPEKKDEVTDDAIKDAIKLLSSKFGMETINKAIEVVRKETKPVENAATKKEVKPAEVKPEVKKEEPIDPQAPAKVELKTQEQLSVVEIKKPEQRDEKIQTAIAEGVSNGELKVTATEKKVEEKPKFMVTFADNVKAGLTDYQTKMFDKVIGKLEKLKEQGFDDDIKITKILVKRFDKENKLITFLLANASNKYPLIEVFYNTGNNRQYVDVYRTANDFVNAAKKRREDAKKDKSLVKKCYNINYQEIPGYVAPSK